MKTPKIKDVSDLGTWLVLIISFIVSLLSIRTSFTKLAWIEVWTISVWLSVIITFFCIVSYRLLGIIKYINEKEDKD